MNTPLIKAHHQFNNIDFASGIIEVDKSNLGQFSDTLTKSYSVDEVQTSELYEELKGKFNHPIKLNEDGLIMDGNFRACCVIHLIKSEECETLYIPYIQTSDFGV